MTIQQAIEQTLAHNPALLADAAEPALYEGAGSRERVCGKIQTSRYLVAIFRFQPTNPASPYYFPLPQLSRLFEHGQKRRWRLDAARAYDVAD